MQRCIRLLAALAALVVVYSAGTAADEVPRPAEPGTLVVVDANGKEQKLKSWKFGLGTRHLTWLAPQGEKAREPTKEKGKAVEKRSEPAGPLALEFRDEKLSTSFARGITILIPLERIRSIDYDNARRSVNVRVAVSDKPEEDERLVGTTKFQGENRLVIEAEVDKGDAGVAAVKLQGGTRDGIRGIRFPTPKPAAPLPAERAVRITASDKARNVHKVVDIQALYVLPDDGLRLLPAVTFSKTYKVDLGQVKRLQVRRAPPKEGAECVVTQQNGEEATLTLLRTIMLDGKTAALEGLIGRVKAGYQLFPINTIAEMGVEEKK